MRAVTDLRECETGKIDLKKCDKSIIKRVDDAKRWMTFLKTAGRKNEI